MAYNPLVSVITATYNSSNFIESTIKSVLSQTYTNWELIIIDDASIDNTLSIIKNYCNRFSKISYLVNKINKGPAFTRNKGVKVAKGDFITFLDGDDIWKPEKLKVQIEFMIENVIDVSYTSYDLIDEDGKPLQKRINALPVLSYNKLLKCNYIGNLTGIYNSKSIGKIAIPDLKKRQDWAMWLNALKKSRKPALGIKESLAFYRVRRHSISSKKYSLLKYNYLVYKKGLGFSILKSVISMAVFLWEYFFVKSKQIVTLKKK